MLHFPGTQIIKAISAKTQMMQSLERKHSRATHPLALGKFEPFYGKLSRTVLTGAGHSNTVCLTRSLSRYYQSKCWLSICDSSIVSLNSKDT